MYREAVRIHDCITGKGKEDSKSKSFITTASNNLPEVVITNIKYHSVTLHAQLQSRLRISKKHKCR